MDYAIFPHKREVHRAAVSNRAGYSSDGEVGVNAGCRIMPLPDRLGESGKSGSAVNPVNAPLQELPSAPGPSSNQ